MKKIGKAESEFPKIKLLTLMIFLSCITCFSGCVESESDIIREHHTVPLGISYAFFESSSPTQLIKQFDLSRFKITTASDKETGAIFYQVTTYSVEQKKGIALWKESDVFRLSFSEITNNYYLAKLGKSGKKSFLYFIIKRDASDRLYLDTEILPNYLSQNHPQYLDNKGRIRKGINLRSLNKSLATMVKTINFDESKLTHYQRIDERDWKAHGIPDGNNDPMYNYIRQDTAQDLEAARLRVLESKRSLCASIIKYYQVSSINTDCINGKAIYEDINKRGWYYGDTGMKVDSMDLPL